MIHAQYDEQTGALLGFYDDEMFDTIPSNTIPITDEEHKTCIADTRLMKVNITTKKLNKTNYVVPVALIRQERLNDVDFLVGRKRAEYITSVAGQETTYTLKAEQARKYLADESRDLANYPFLTYEAVALNTPIETLAKNILANEATWLTLAAKLEALRVSTKARIKVTKQTDLESVFTTFVTALSEL